MSRKGSDGWRYQAVYTSNNSDNNETSKEYSLCEVYLDKDGKLESWTESRFMSPMGYTVDELMGDLQIMLDDAAKWKPVEFESMQVGMCFQRSDNNK
ncbi:MAG: hypothetical protein FWD82_01265 [Defluviitaleaceae bacterium]|nr:hypothetical protein [Defluviitaleaceae bacterium]